MSKILKYNNEFHNKILSGLEKAERCVCATLGPAGRPVLMNNGHQTSLTKDGITVFREIELDDPIENSAIMALREASAKVASEAGDGTTTVTSLGVSIYRNGLKYTSANVNPVMVKSGLDKAAKAAISSIKSKARKISTKEDIKNVCLISSNGDEKISDVISDVFTKLGPDATIKIEESGSEIGYEIVDGFQLPNTGYMSPFFCTSDNMTCNFEKAYVLVFDGRLTNINELLPTLQSIAKAGVPLLIFADSVETEVLSNIIMNRIRTGLQVCCVRSPSYGEYRKAIYRDIAAITNGKVVSEETGIKLSQAVLGKDVLGFAKSVVVTKENTTIVGSGDNKELLDEYIANLKCQIDQTKDEFDLEKMKERYARLTNGIGKINIFAPTEIELKELRDRVDDAFCAARAAILEGVVPGGGSSLLAAKVELDSVSPAEIGIDPESDEVFGLKILSKSLESPIRGILENAGLDSSLVVEKIVEKISSGEDDAYGYNVSSKCYSNMFSTGIVDPCAVECSAIKNAVSVAGLLLTSSSCIVYDADKEQQDKMDRI